MAAYREQQPLYVHKPIVAVEAVSTKDSKQYKQRMKKVVTPADAQQGEATKKNNIDPF